MTTPAPTDKAPLMLLEDARVAVRLDDKGFLTRIRRDVKLTFGTELYSACKGEPRPTDRVLIYQPGYMKLAAACGGQLTCPPVMKHPVTGEPVPNPYVERHPSGVIKSVTATAVCVVRDFGTGAYHASVQTITIDAELVLRQALMNITRDDCVRLMVDADFAAEREKGELRGWASFPLAPPVVIAADLSKQGVREALATYQNQAATIRQRACTKAERLAADHNPVLRRTWAYSELVQPGNGALPFVLVPVVAWVEHQGDAELDAMLRTLATVGSAKGVESVVANETLDVDFEAVDNGIDDDTEPAALTERVPEAIPTPEKVRAPVVDSPDVRAKIRNQLADIDAELLEVSDPDFRLRWAAVRGLHNLPPPHMVLPDGLALDVMHAYRDAALDLLNDAPSGARR